MGKPGSWLPRMEQRESAIRTHAKRLRRHTRTLLGQVRMHIRGHDEGRELPAGLIWLGLAKGGLADLLNGSTAYVNCFTSQNVANWERADQLILYEVMWDGHLQSADDSEARGSERRGKERVRSQRTSRKERDGKEERKERGTRTEQ